MITQAAYYYCAGKLGFASGDPRTRVIIFDIYIPSPPEPPRRGRYQSRNTVEEALAAAMAIRSALQAVPALNRRCS